MVLRFSATAAWSSGTALREALLSNGRALPRQWGGAYLGEGSSAASPEEAAQRAGIEVADLCGHGVDGQRGGAQQVGGAFEPDLVDEISRGHPDFGLGGP